MATIGDRIREVQRARKEAGISTREMARRGGFKTDSQLWNTADRLDAKPDAIELGTVRRVAAGLGVRFEWLLCGVGPRDLDTVVEYDERYPNLSKAVNALAEEILPATAAEVRSVALKSNHDLSVNDWIDQIRAIDRRQRLTLRDPAGEQKRRADAAKKHAQNVADTHAVIEPARSGVLGDYREKLEPRESASKGRKPKGK